MSAKGMAAAARMGFSLPWFACAALVAPAAAGRDFYKILGVGKKVRRLPFVKFTEFCKTQ